MEELIYLLGYLGIINLYIVLSFTILILIQFISYRIFHFNLYKFMIYNLFTRRY